LGNVFGATKQNIATIKDTTTDQTCKTKKIAIKDYKNIHNYHVFPQISYVNTPLLPLIFIPIQKNKIKKHKIKCKTKINTPII